jgi:hypothetical protein
MDGLFPDISFGHRLAFQNVVSSRSKFHYGELAERVDRFASALADKGCESNGPLFYSLNNVPMDEIVDLEMFTPIQQDAFAAEEGFRFHSYFEVSPLLRGIVTGDFETQTEMVYAHLMATLEANDLQINSPFFHVLRNDVSPYASVYLGYRDPVNSTDPDEGDDAG